MNPCSFCGSTIFLASRCDFPSNHTWGLEKVDGFCSFSVPFLLSNNSLKSLILLSFFILFLVALLQLFLLKLDHQWNNCHSSAWSFRCENAFFGATLFNWFPIGHDSSISRVSVAADYSDSVPDSSNYVANKGYHPLEELRDCRRVRDKRLTSAEIARTAVEVLPFP